MRIANALSDCGAHSLARVNTLASAFLDGERMTESGRTEADGDRLRSPSPAIRLPVKGRSRPESDLSCRDGIWLGDRRCKMRAQFSQKAVYGRSPRHSAALRPITRCVRCSEGFF
ncbi:protein of unknown function (plasmid) [Caballeronia sp. S22]